MLERVRRFFTSRRALDRKFVYHLRGFQALCLLSAGAYGFVKDTEHSTAIYCFVLGVLFIPFITIVFEIVRGKHIPNTYEEHEFFQ